MNRSLQAFGLLLLALPALAQQPAHGSGTCFSLSKMSPWIQVDAQTALVQAGNKSYLVTVPDCSSFFTGKTAEVLGSNGSRVCRGDEIRYYDVNQYVESCFITNIARYNP